MQLFCQMPGTAPARSIDVSSDWARWISSNRERISALHILCGSRFIQLTAGFVADLPGSRSDVIYRERGPFEMALREQIG